MSSAAAITRWRNDYAKATGAPVSVFTDFGDDIALAMKHMIEAGKTPRAAYDVVTNGLYAESRAVAANGRRRKRASRRNKRTSRKRRGSR